MAATSGPFALQAQLDDVLTCEICAPETGCPVALTIHDLPMWPHWTSKVGQPPDTIVSKILAAFEKHGLKGVYNMTNSGTGLIPDDKSTILPYNERFKGLLDQWVEAGHHIANHTHSHAAVHQLSLDDLKEDFMRADSELAPWISKAPRKYCCLCLDCQGPTKEIAEDLAKFVVDKGYTHLPACSMVFDWHWEMAYIGALGAGDAEMAAKIRSEFIDYSVKQTLCDWTRGSVLYGPSFTASLLLHVLNIVADTIDDWIAAMQKAGCRFVSADQCFDSTNMFKELAGLADPVPEARASLMKVGKHRGLVWPESAPNEEKVIAWVRKLGDEAVAAGHLVMTDHLGDREIPNDGKSG